MVYFIADYKNNVCKIGFSERPKRRLKSLQTGYPFNLSLVKTIKGDIMLEKSLHYKYRDIKIKGEWFKLDGIDELKNIISGNIININVCNLSVNFDSYTFYFNLTSFIKSFNISQFAEPFSTKNISAILNTEHIKELNNSILEKGIQGIIKHGHTWVHPLIFFDILRSISHNGNFKILAYTYILKNLGLARDVLKDNNQAIRLGIEKSL